MLYDFSLYNNYLLNKSQPKGLENSQQDESNNLDQDESFFNRQKVIYLCGGLGALVVLLIVFYCIGNRFVNKSSKALLQEASKIEINPSESKVQELSEELELKKEELVQFKVVEIASLESKANEIAKLKSPNENLLEVKDYEIANLKLEIENLAKGNNHKINELSLANNELIEVKDRKIDELSLANKNLVKGKEIQISNLKSANKNILKVKDNQIANLKSEIENLAKGKDAEIADLRFEIEKLTRENNQKIDEFTLANNELIELKDKEIAFFKLEIENLAKRNDQKIDELSLKAKKIHKITVENKELLKFKDRKIDELSLANKELVELKDKEIAFFKLEIENLAKVKNNEIAKLKLENNELMKLKDLKIAKSGAELTCKSNDEILTKINSLMLQMNEFKKSTIRQDFTPISNVQFKNINTSLKNSLPKAEEDCKEILALFKKYSNFFPINFENFDMQFQLLKTLNEMNCEDYKNKLKISIISKTSQVVQIIENLKKLESFVKVSHQTKK